MNRRKRQLHIAPSRKFYIPITRGGSEHRMVSSKKFGGFKWHVKRSLPPSRWLWFCSAGLLGGARLHSPTSSSLWTLLQEKQPSSVYAAVSCSGWNEGLLPLQATTKSLFTHVARIGADLAGSVAGLHARAIDHSIAFVTVTRYIPVELEQKFFSSCLSDRSLYE
jgi:hypothetical protein